MKSTMHVISECGMEETLYAFLTKIYCQFVTEGVPSGAGWGE